MMNEDHALTPDADDNKPYAIASRATSIARETDDRDETIRMLNEALSEALAELELQTSKAA